MEQWTEQVYSHQDDFFGGAFLMDLGQVVETEGRVCTVFCKWLGPLSSFVAVI